MEDVLALLAGLVEAVRSSRVYEGLTSYTAQRIYALAGMLLITGLAVLTAIGPLRGLHRETDYETLVKRLKIPGPEPSRAATIAAQKARKLETARDYAQCTIGRIAITALLGVVLPFAAILTVTWQGGWFFPGQPVLVEAGSRTPIPHPDAGQLSAFGLDLLLKGGLNDVIETFEWEIGQVRHAATNYPYATLILLFRLVADLFVISLLFYAGRTALNWRRASAEVMREAQNRELASAGA
ncbi:hypothetical protein E5163_02755 [Marinicauda algicola]|uniref:Uncharacterized protein n=1 Tax=Marinicauda algicola TaxID=2029849 RepID=A0A4S2H381_9PROT|nr:hypothetical protein [Marinicauda algicola]TGY90065.1 hypothetical protein E5163_02755 [Marinicauda algicola]